MRFQKFFVITKFDFSQILLNDSTLDFVEIKSIQIKGNKKTRDNIILRETDFKVGSKIQKKNSIVA